MNHATGQHHREWYAVELKVMPRCSSQNQINVIKMKLIDKNNVQNLLNTVCK